MSRWKWLKDFEKDIQTASVSELNTRIRYCESRLGYAQKIGGSIGKLHAKTWLARIRQLEKAIQERAEEKAG